MAKLRRSCITYQNATSNRDLVAYRTRTTAAHPLPRLIKIYPGTVALHD